MADYRSVVGGSSPAPVATPAASRPMAAQPQAVPAQPQGDGYTSIFDRFWTDNFWDNVWTDDFSAVPVVGPVAAATARAVDVNYKRWNNVLSWGVSALPGGMDTMSWEGAGRVSPGQAVVTNAQALSQGNMVERAWGTVGEKLVLDPMRGEDPNNPLFRDDFNVENDAQRKEAFEQGGIGQAATGFTDTMFMFFLDPLVIGGKAIKIARFGTEAFGGGRITGLTNRSLASARSVQKVGDEADTAINLYRQGVTGKGDNMLGTYADQVVAGDFTALRELPIFQNAHRDLLAGIAGQIDDKEDAIVFLAAAAGNQKYIRELHQRHHAAYDAFRRAAESPVYEADLFKKNPGEWGPAILANATEADINAKLLLDDLARRNESLAKAVAEVDEGSQLISRMGMVDNPLAVRGAQIAAAWRATGRRGAARASRAESLSGDAAKAAAYGVDLAPAEIQRMNRVAAQGTGPAGFETVFTVAGPFRRVRVWDWLGGYHASGFVAVRGPDIGKSSDEILAALSDSKTIRGDKAFMYEQLNLFGRAVSDMDRTRAVMQIEQNVIKKLAEKYEISDDGWREIYKRLDERRYETVNNFKNRAYGVDPVTGDLIKSTPKLRSQLETKMPMLDFDMLEDTMRLAARSGVDWKARDKAWQLSQAGINFLDQAQSIWKASVLLRLGYTQRNVAEGWLRTAAVLGTIPALKHPWQSAKNFNFNMNQRTAYRLGRQWRKEEGGLQKEVLQLQKELRLETDLLKQQTLQAKIDAKITRMNELVELRGKLAQRRQIGDDGAFAGELGDLYRREASGYVTMEQFLESEWMRRRNYTMADNNWSRVKPGKPQYWSELAGAVQQFRNDKVALMALEGKSEAEIVKWLDSAAGREYRQAMRISHKGVPEHVATVTAMVNRYLPTVESRAAAAQGLLQESELVALLGHLEKGMKAPKKPNPAKYFDQNGQFDQKKYDRAVKAYEKRKATYEQGGGLSDIHGREVAQVVYDPTVGAVVKGAIDTVFKYIGTMPEAVLVRQPFYNEVWTREFNRLQKLAVDQGSTLTPEVLERINTLSHRVAMRATNETLYTIERMSNVAQLMRFIAPFFPAWENSFKAWAKIIVNDPSVLARAGVLWQAPAAMGMVVDENGNRVPPERWNFTSGSQDRFVMLPKPLNDVIMEMNGGVPVKVPQGSLNVVTPGETPWLPGFGPLTAIPVGEVLKTRPDVQAWIRTEFPLLWSQIAPMGEVQTAIDALPSAGRKALQLIRGEDDATYLQVVNSIMAARMVEWNRSGNDPALKPRYEDVIAEAQQFYQFSIMASLSLPFATTRMSKYQAEVDLWRAIQADPDMEYGAKVDAFLAKVGDEFLPLVTSTSEYAGGRISPDMGSWKLLTDNEALIREISALGDPEAIGVIASTAPKGEFDLGVYGALGEMRVPGTNDPYRTRKSPQEMQNAIVMQDAWRVYNVVKTARDEAMKKLGVTSLQSKEAANIKMAWQLFTDQYMVKKYGEQWQVAHQSWQDKTPVFLTAIVKALTNEDFMAKNGQTPTWGLIRKYMDGRAQLQAAVQAGQVQASDATDALKAWAATFKDTDFGFSDFYDNFLENDKLDVTVAYG